jgi:hypothetical protein
MRDDAERDDRIKRGKKYGGWAWSVSDAEAEETFQNYSVGIQLLKQIVEGVFGKNHTYYVENDSYASEEGIHLDVFPELGKHFCHMEIAVELDADPRMMVTAHFGDYLKSIKSFDCDFDELLKEIDSESNAWDYGGDFTPWELSCDAEGELEWDDDDEWSGAELNYSLLIQGSGYWSLPSVDTLDEYFERIKEIIDSHKKKTAKKGS